MSRMTGKRLGMMMMCTMLLAVLFASGFLETSQAARAEGGGTTYYLDAADGKDSHKGTSPDKAWQSLDKVNKTVFQPGDVILLKAGCEWIGTLSPKGSGSEGKPIVIDMYGTGPKPAVHGNGAAADESSHGGAAVYLYNQQYWEINNLEVTNLTTKAPAERYGIHIVAEDIGTANHIYIRNNVVHDVKGSNNLDHAGNADMRTKYNGGIFVRVLGSKTPTSWNDVRIENNEVYEVQKLGIATRSSWSRGSNWSPFTNVLIQNNYLHEIAADGIVSSHGDGQIIQHNVVYRANKLRVDYAVAIWTVNSDNAVVQYNEAFNTYKGKGDGTGFDADVNSSNTTIQYNYSHDNEGGFVLLMGNNEGTSKNITVRYNISQNDGGTVFLAGGTIDQPNTQIYNNTVYIKAGMNTAVSNIWKTASFRNNLIVNYGSGAGYGGTWDRNLFYPGTGSGTNSINADPKLSNPGTGAIGAGTVDGYKLLVQSPALASGVVIDNNGGLDYWGNPVPAESNPAIGAYNGSGIEATRLTAQADSYVRDGIYSAKNYGADTVLTAKAAPKPDFSRETLLKFDLGEIAAPVNSAKLRIYISGLSAPADLLVYRGSTNSWDESSVVWGDVQAEGEALANVSLKSGGDWLELDVTPWIQAAAAGEERIITFLLKGADNQDQSILIHSKENANKPHLYIQ